MSSNNIDIQKKQWGSKIELYKSNSLLLYIFKNLIKQISNFYYRFFKKIVRSAAPRNKDAGEAKNKLGIFGGRVLFSAPPLRGTAER